MHIYISSGSLKKRRLSVPDTDKTRPMTQKLRMKLFNTLQFMIEGSSVLDLFAGTGALGIEALSRGATNATFVEINSLPFKTLTKNIKTLELNESTYLHQQDAFSYIKMLKNNHYDLVFVAPPYSFTIEQYQLLLSTFDSKKAIKDEGILCIEVEKDKLHFFESLSLQYLKLYKTKNVGTSYILLFEG